MAQTVGGRADHLAVAHVVGGGLTGGCRLLLDLARTLGSPSLLVSLAPAVAAAVLPLEAAVHTSPGLAAGGSLGVLASLSLQQSLTKKLLLLSYYKNALLYLHQIILVVSDKIRTRLLWLAIKPCCVIGTRGITPLVFSTSDGNILVVKFLR